MGKRKRKAAPKRKGRAAAVEARKRPSARRVPTTRKQPAKKKVAPKAHARTRAPAKLVDWSKRAAPKKGSPARAAYEKSPVYRKRARAQKKAQETRRKNVAREQRRLAREERVAIAKERLGTLLARVVSDYKRRRQYSDTELDKHGKRSGPNREGIRGARNRLIREHGSHANWYRAKLGFDDAMGRRDFERVLEELTLEHDLDALGWDIIY